MREVFGFIRRSLDKEAVKQYLKEREEQFTNIDEDAYDLIAAMTEITVDGVTGTVTFNADGEPEKGAKFVKIVDGAYTAVE